MPAMLINGKCHPGLESELNANPQTANLPDEILEVRTIIRCRLPV
jgi:hypothetical protein